MAQRVKLVGGLVDKNQDSKYPSWKDSAPNLQTFLNAINKSQPIITCQFEVVFSRWPRTIFFAKNITIPGLTVNILELNHAGFTIPIPTHVAYESTELTMNILADKEGYHYYDLRNMVIQTGHPLIAGDPRATVGNNFDISPTEDTIEVRLRNDHNDEIHHHWIIHNFKPTGIGDIDLAVDTANFLEFELKGTFTHISYDCGKSMPAQKQSEESQKVMDSEPEKQASSEPQEPVQNSEPQEKEEQQEEQKPPEADRTDENGEVKLNDEDDQVAYDVIKNGGFRTATEMKEEIRNQLKEKSPNEEDDILDCRTNEAFEKAKAYDKQESEKAQKKGHINITKKGEMLRDYENETKLNLIIVGDKGGLIPVTGDYPDMDILVKAVRYNHNITDEVKKLFVDDKLEIETYKNRIAHLTLPYRFGMYKRLKNRAEYNPDIVLEDPEPQLDSTSSENIDQNHKVRPIFPLDD